MPDEGEMEDEDMDYGDFEDEEMYLRGALTGKGSCKLPTNQPADRCWQHLHTRPLLLQARRTKKMQQGRRRRRTRPLTGARPSSTAPWTRCRCWRACSSSRRTRMWARSSRSRCWPAASDAPKRHWPPRARWGPLLFA